MVSILTSPDLWMAHYLYRFPNQLHQGKQTTRMVKVAVADGDDVHPGERNAKRESILCRGRRRASVRQEGEIVSLHEHAQSPLGQQICPAHSVFDKRGNAYGHRP